MSVSLDGARARTSFAKQSGQCQETQINLGETLTPRLGEEASFPNNRNSHGAISHEERRETRVCEMGSFRTYIAAEKGATADRATESQM